MLTIRCCVRLQTQPKTSNLEPKNKKGTQQMSAINTFRTSRQFQCHCRLQLYEDRIPQNTHAVDSFLNRFVLEHSLMCVYTVTRMLLQSHNISAHLFLQRFVPSKSRWHPHRNLYHIYHIDNRTQKYLPGTNRCKKGVLQSYNLFAQLYSVQHLCMIRQVQIVEHKFPDIVQHFP